MSIFLSRTKYIKHCHTNDKTTFNIFELFLYSIKTRRNSFHSPQNLNPQKSYTANQTKIQDYFKKIQPIKYLERRFFMPYIYLLIAIITEIIGTSF